MSAAPPQILITGFLGAGKSALAAHLRTHTGATASVIEVNGLCTPDPSPGPVQAIVAVADAANLPTTLADALVGHLISAQIRMADVVVVTRSDATDPQPTVDAVKKLTDSPVLIVPHGKIDPADLPPHQAKPRPNIELTPQFQHWEHSGRVTFKAEQAETLLERRPKGIYRIWGQVRTDVGGLDLQLAGRVRQITKVDRPDDTHLQALGPKTAFKRFQMDGLFSEYAAASAHLSGLFSHR